MQKAEVSERSLTLETPGTGSLEASRMATAAPQTLVGARPLAADVGNYVADEHKHNHKRIELDKKFNLLCSTARTAAGQMLASNEIFYRHCVELVFFFHSAKGTDYLHELIKKRTNRQYKAKVSHGYNFAPLIDAVWMGVEAKDLPTNKSNRISRALNRVYEVWGSAHGYRADAKPELVAYMFSQGGISGLVNYKADEDAMEREFEPDLKADKQAIRKASDIASLAVQKAYADSLMYFRDRSDLPTVRFDFDIAVNDDDVSLVLVNRKDESQYAVIDTVVDRAQVSRALTRSYLGQYGVLPPAVRFIAEILATQCCPAEHDSTYVHLLNEAGRVSSGRAKSALRRLIYRHQKRDFLLSNIRGNHGLVTVAKPRMEVLAESIDDVALTTLSRRLLETYLVSPKNFRMLRFTLDIGLGPIPSARSDFTHALKVKVLAGNDGSSPEVPIYFHRENLERQPENQVDVLPYPDDQLQWKRSLSPEWFKRFNAAFTHNWVNSHARHINRPQHTVLGIQFKHSTLTVNFFNLDNEADLHTMVAVPTGHPQFGQSRSFLSKDFAIAMLQIADLPIKGEVEMALFPSYLRLSYETDVGEYAIYLPAAISTGERKDEGFTNYNMQSIIPEDQHMDDLIAAEEQGDQGEEDESL